MAFSCHVSSVTWHISSAFCLSWLELFFFFFRNKDQLFCRIFLNMSFSDMIFFHNQIHCIHLWQNTLSDFFCLLFSINEIKRKMILVCLSIGDIKFGHMVKVMSTRFLHYKFTIFSYVINLGIVRRYFETI